MKTKFYPFASCYRNILALFAFLFSISLHAQTVVTTNPNSWNTVNVIGDLIISGDFITDLSGMNGASPLSTVSGNLTIENLNSPSISNLNGLQSLALVEGDVIIRNCNGANFNSLLGLQGLFTVQGDLIVENCNNLGDLIQLANVMTIGGELRISNNASLTSMGPSTPWNLTNVSDVFIGNNPSFAGTDPFQNVTTTGVIEIRQNHNMAFIASFSNLVSVENLLIIHNNGLSSVSGFENIQNINYIEINNNSSLAICCFATHLLAKSVAPPAILANAVGCESVAVVNAPPTLDMCMANQTVNVDPNSCENLFLMRLPIAADNCDFLSQEVRIVFGDGFVWHDGPYGGGGSSFNYTTRPGINTFEFKATDQNGNIATCNTIITVEDNQQPELITGFFPFEYFVETGENCDVGSGSVGIFQITAAGFTDNCAVIEYQIEINGVENIVVNGFPGENFTFELDPGDYDVTIRAADGGGNVNDRIVSMRVVDNSPPVWDNHAFEKTVEVACGTSTIEAAVEANAPTASGCGIVDVFVIDRQFVTSPCGPDGEEVTYRVRDEYGNEEPRMATVTVVFTDEVKPILSGVPVDITIGCNDNIPAFPSVTAIDACDGNLTNSITFSQVPGMGSCGNGEIAQSFKNTVTVQDACGNVSEKIWNVTIVSDFAYSLGPDIQVCDGGSNVTLDPGIAGDTYLWSTGATSQAIAVNQSGTYSLTVTTSNGCCFIDEINVSTGENPDVFAQGGAIDCSSGALQISGGSATNDVTYLWSGPSGFSSSQQNPTVSEAGTYTLIVTTASGCAAEIDVEVTSDTDVPNASADGGIISCSSPNTQIFASSTTADVIYEWSGPDAFTSTEQNPTVSVIGDYTLKVTAENGCFATVMIAVTGNSEVPTAELTSSKLTCTNSEVLITVTSTATILSYSWIGPDGFSSTDASPSVDIAGIYEVTITGVNGCPATENIDIEEDTLAPDIIATGGTLSCTSNAVTLNATSSFENVTYSWSGPDNFTSSLQTPQASQPGTYNITIIGENGCSTLDSVMVMADTDLPDVSAIGGVIDCITEEVLLQGSTNTANAVISWIGPNGFVSTQLDNLVSIPGMYTFTVVSESGCTSFKTVEVILDNKTPDLSIGSGAVDCIDATRQFNVNTNAEQAVYNWTGPDGYNSAEPAPSYTLAGLYSLTVTGSNNCSSTSSLEIDNNIAFDVEIVLTGSQAEAVITGGTGPFSFVWDSEFGESMKSDLLDGDHSLSIVDGLGCVKDFTFTISTTNTLEEEFDLKIDVYPNPVSDFLFLKNRNHSHASNLEIFNSTGLRVIRKSIIADTTEVNVQNLETGIYLIRIEIEDKVFIKKFMKI